ncbi:unnamed protein product [Lactuca virosa]|uniref:Non-specific serine/threonine protein kinase n=1 Tax=Lactuca virosa TaxID=75947 RepID=A0AAU9LVG9_9ASTR|nr:unnamed protein product [Lactuca virosa]
MSTLGFDDDKAKELAKSICYMLHMYDHYVAATRLNYLASRMGPSSSSSSSSSQFHLGVFPQILGFLFFFLSIGASGTTFTFINDCGFTVCPGVNGWTDSNTGFELTKGTACSFQAPVGWSGRIWGFFGEGYRYLGIWYTEDVESRKIWLANPNTPIISTSGANALSIDVNTGDLIIIAGGRTLMSITNVQISPNPNVTASLEENGNFRLIDEIEKRVLWQSFDHPSNVLLPGMKLGYDMTKRKNWTLTSWLSNDIPSSGAFTMSWEPIEEASQRLMIRRRGQPYWTSGSLNNQIFQYMFSLNGPSSQSRYNHSFVYTNEARYFSYEANNIAALPMWILTAKGQVTDIDNSTVWTPEYCYGYDSGNGCVESSLPQCRRDSDKFSEMKGDFAHDLTRSVIDDNSSLSISDCFVKCWNDCTCVGFNSSSINGTGCVIWTGSNNFLVNTRDNSTLKYVINQNPINPSTGTKTEKSKNWEWILIGAVIPLFFLCFGILWYIKKRKHKRKEYEIWKRDEYFLELTASESFKDIHQLENNGGKGNDLLLFSIASIMAATDDFSIENKLRQGGFGPVYKGRLSDGREIAIKRLSRTSGQGLIEFKNELVLIAKLQHTNLVQISSSLMKIERQSWIGVNDST